MTFTESISTCLKKYATFEGTASRSEYWWFFLFQIIVGAVAAVISPKLNTVLGLVFLLPSIAAATRRLHDTDRSGWFQLLYLLPIIGWIMLLVFFVQEGKPNRFETGVRDPVHAG